MSSGPSLSWTDAALGGAQELPHARGGAATASWSYASQDVLFIFGGCSYETNKAQSSVYIFHVQNGEF